MAKFSMTRYCLFVLFLAQSTYAEVFQFDLAGAVLTGDLEGYMQTPAGGQPNRSDVNRPTFAELGIDSFTAYETEFGVSWAKNRVYAGASILRDSQSTVLSADLLSQWQQFRQGDVVDADIQLDWFKVGYLRSFQPKSWDRLSFEVGGDVVLFSFSYQLTNGEQNVDRAYSKGGYRLGGKANYAFSDRLSVNAGIFVPLPASGSAEIFSFDIICEYKFTRSISGFAGIGVREIDFEDNQEFTNHVVAEMNPSFQVGMKVFIGRE